METDTPKSITFKKAIYGFDSIKKYTLSKASPEDGNPFRRLDAMDESVSFVLLDPKIIDQSYNPLLEEKIIRLLKVKDIKNLEVYSIVVIPNDIKRMTINLRSPIIINIENGNAMQIILEDERYSVRYRIFDC